MISKERSNQINRNILTGYMIKFVSPRTKEIARQIPYHLQYIREGKPNIKPEVENEKVVRNK